MRTYFMRLIAYHGRRQESFSRVQTLFTLVSNVSIYRLGVLCASTYLTPNLLTAFS